MDWKLLLVLAVVLFMGSVSITGLVVTSIPVQVAKLPAILARMRGGFSDSGLASREHRILLRLSSGGMLVATQLAQARTILDERLATTYGSTRLFAVGAVSLAFVLWTAYLIVTVRRAAIPGGHWPERED